MEENHKKYYRLSLYLFILGFLSILILIFSVLSMVLFFTSHNQGSAVGGGDQTPDIIRNFVFFFAFVSPISFITSFIFRVLAHKPLRQWYDFISLFLVSIFVSFTVYRSKKNIM